MATIGDLVVNLSANAAGVATGCSSALTSLKGFAASAVSPLTAAASAAFPLITSLWGMGSSLFDSAVGLATIEGIPAPFAPIQSSLDSLQGALAGILTPSIQEFNLLLYDVADMVMSMLGPAVDQTSAICQNWGETLRGWVSEGLDLVYNGLVAGIWALKHWQEVGQLAGIQVMLSFVTMGNSIVHFFTGTLPALFRWFGDNWRDLFSTAASFVGSVFTNIASNIGNAMKAIWDFIASGGSAELELAWTPLLTGFENTVKELPNLPERVAGDLEKALTTERDRLANIVGGGIQEAMAGAPGRRKALPKAAVPEGTPQQLVGEKAGRQEQNAALLRGSAEAVNAIVSAANGERDSLAERNARAAEEAVAVQQKQNDILIDIKAELEKEHGLQAVKY